MAGKRYITLRISIVGAFSALLIVISSFLITYIGLSNYNLVLGIADEVFEKKAEAVIANTVDYLAPGKHVSGFMASVITTGIVDADIGADEYSGAVVTEPGYKLADMLDFMVLNRFASDELTIFEQYFLELIRNHPQIVYLYAGDMSGGYFLIEKRGGGLKRITGRRRENGEIRPYSKIVNSFDEIVSFEDNPVEFANYDPRMRPWFTGARKSGKMCVTEPYMWVSDILRMGISVSHVIRDRDGRLQGVAACDIDILDISRFLLETREYEESTILIIDGNDDVVAMSDQISRHMISNGNDVFMPHIRDCAPRWLLKALQAHRETGLRRVSTSYKGQRYRVSFNEFPDSIEQSWRIVVGIPEEVLVHRIKQRQGQLKYLAGFMTVLALLIIIRISTNVSQPVKKLAAHAHRLALHDLKEKVEVDTRIAEIKDMAIALEKFRSIFLIFKKFVPSGLVERMLKTGIKADIGGKNARISVLFVTIRIKGHEAAVPEDMFVALSGYFNEITRIITRNHGVVDKYLDNMIMAFWGAPAEDPMHERNACKAALLIKEKIGEMNESGHNEGRPPVEVVIGVHSGAAVVGNIGSVYRMDYTALGDTVNVACRLQGLCAKYGVHIVTSMDTLEEAGDDFQATYIDTLNVKGRAEPVRIYSLGDSMLP